MPTLEEFKSIVRSGDFVVLDTETTGLHNAEIIQMGLIGADGKVLMNDLIKPVRPIPEDAIRIHGITNEMVADKPGMIYFYNQIKDFISGRNVIVFNVAYDQKILYDALEIAGIERVEWSAIAKWWCAMEAFSEIKGDWNAKRKSYKWQSLTKACEHYQIPMIDAHDALGDCQSTLHICRKMVGAEPRSNYISMYED